MSDRFNRANALPFPEIEPSACLPNLCQSLHEAFGDAVSVEMAGDELKVVIGGKAAWLNRLGQLTGEASTPPYEG